VNRDTVLRYISIGPPGGDLQRISASDRLTSMSFTDVAEKTDKLSITLDNRDLKLLGSAYWKKGNEIEVVWGYPGWLAQPRRCVIEKISGGDMLKVEAHDKGTLLHKRARMRRFTNLKRSEVAEQIAKENGYTANRRWIQDTKVRLEEITQQRSTDAQFLQRLARSEGFEYFVDFDGFHFHEAAVRGRPQLLLRYHSDPFHGEIQSFNIEEIITAAMPGGLKMVGRDRYTKRPFEVVATNDTVQRDTLGATVELPSTDDAAADPLAQSIGSFTVLRSFADTEEEAAREVAQRWKRIQLGAVKMTITARGIPSLLAKSTIRIEGLGATADGNYYIEQIQHKTDVPYMMTLKTKRDGKNAATAPYEAGLPGQGAGTASAGKLNDKDALASDQLVPVVEEDPDTGLLKTSFDVGGREIPLFD
jgi:phage protein D